MRTVPTSELAAPDMAVRAGRAALAAAASDADDIGVLIHAWTYHQGHDFWSPAHYVANQLGATRALPFGVQQMCNAGALALGDAAMRLRADPDTHSALVTTADRFCPPGFDRWGGDYAVVYGDAATAVLLGTDTDTDTGLVLRSITFESASEFELMYRGTDLPSSAARSHSPAVDVRRTKKAYLEQAGGMAGFAAIASGKVRDVVARALADAEVDPGDPRVTLTALPRLSDSVVDLMYVSVLRGQVGGEVLRLTADTGHLGAGDMAANLAHIQREDLLDSGRIAVLVGGGGGFSWSCAVVEAR